MARRTVAKVATDEKVNMATIESGAEEVLKSVRADCNVVESGLGEQNDQRSSAEVYEKGVEPQIDCGWTKSAGSR